MTAESGDDRLAHVVPFLLERLESLKRGRDHEESPRPLMMGLNGIQGCGKTTLVERLEKTLSNPPHSLNLVVFSLDDLYLTHDEQQRLAAAHPANPLIQHRGQPSTHDVDLGAGVLESLRLNRRTEIPAYDKSAFAGQGDRAPRDRARVVDPVAAAAGGGAAEVQQRRPDIVILEGWCIGFRSLPAAEVEREWRRARDAAASDSNAYNGRLGHNKLDNILFVNDELKRYDRLTDQFDALIHIDAEDTHYVYDWRLQAEHAMRQARGSGMTDEQVKVFVDGYYPSYELYTSALRAGAYPGQPHKQLRLVVDVQRKLC